MSLMDAMLLEGYREPRDVYIALRSDGLKGSGTIDDPYDGGTKLESTLDATLTCDRFEFVIGTPFSHGVTTVGASVQIAGAVGPAASWFNGTFTVTEITSPLHLVVKFDPSKTGTPPVNLPVAPPYVPYYFHGDIKITLPGGSTPLARIYWPVARVTTTSVPHDLPTFGAAQVNIGSPNASFGGRYAAFGPDAATGRSFRYRLSFLPAANVTTPVACTINRVVHRYDEILRVTPTNSLIHLGSGTFETRGYASIYVANESDYSQLHVGCIIRIGQRIAGVGLGITTLKLVLPIDEYNQTSTIGNPSSPKADYAEVCDLTVDCNASGHVAPFGLFPMPVTCGAVSIGGSFIRVHRVRAVQFCDQARAECFPFFTTGSQGEAPVFNVQEGCIMEQPGQNNTHETSLMNNVSGDSFANAISPIVRHNFADCTYVRPDGSRYSSRYVAVASITQHAGPDFDLYTLVTKEPHNRTAAHNVKLNGISGLSIFDMRVVQVISATELVFRVPGVTGVSPISTDSNGAFLGVDFHATEAFSGTGCVTEGNAMFDVPEAFYVDAGSTRDGVVRDNYYSNILRGQYFNFPPSGGGGFTEAQNAKSLTRSVVGGKLIATFQVADGTPSEPSPNLRVRAGDVVKVDGAKIDASDPPEETYNDSVIVMAVAVDRRSFTYEMKFDPEDPADLPTVAEPIFFQGYWQTRRLVVENNVYDLHRFDINQSNVNLVPRGMTSVAFSGGPPFIFPDTVIRENLFRHLDDAVPIVDPSNGSYLFALRLSSYDRALIQGNIINIPTTVHRMHHSDSGKQFNAFGNLTSEGSLVRLFKDVSGFAGGSYVEQDSLENRIYDSLLMALL